MNSSNNHNNNHNHNDDDNDNDNNDDDDDDDDDGDDDDDDNEIIAQKFYEQYSLCTLLNYCTLVLSYFLNDKENIVAVLFHF